MPIADTPTLLANASAGQLLDDATYLEGIAAHEWENLPDRVRLLRLAELARAVAMASQLTEAESDKSDMDSLSWEIDARGLLRSVWVTRPPTSLCAALASTRHTQGEADVQAR